MNLPAARGVAVREFKMKDGHGFADYLLFVDEKPVGVIEAKATGHTLSGVQTQARRYSDGLPDALSPPLRPLPFLYSSTGVETLFINLRDPEPRSRRVFSFHRPATFAEWLGEKPLADWVEGWRSSQEMEERGLAFDRSATLRLPTLRSFRGTSASAGASAPLFR